MGENDMEKHQKENEQEKTIVALMKLLVSSAHKKEEVAMTKTKEFKFRLTEKEFEEMRELAEQEGRTMSNLLRYLVAKERKEKSNAEQG